MSKRRYDDVVRFVSSIIFGTSFRQFHEVNASLERLGCTNPYIAFITTIVFFAVFFRNVHGLIAYDLWVENSQHEYAPSFEHKTRHIVWNFIFAFLGAILFPYLLIYNLAGDSGSSGHICINNSTVVAIMLFLPMFAYFFWNIFWLVTLRRNSLRNDTKEYERAFPLVSWFPWPSYFREWILRKTKPILNKIPALAIKTPTDTDWNKYRAYVDILDFTILWVLIDIFLIITAGYGSLFVTLKWPNSFYHLCIMYSIIATIVLLLDYCSHVEYYFPTPVRPKEFYEFGPLWEYVLPDGVKFCHWGGRESSEELKDRLAIKATDTVIELCCGQGGTLSLLPDAKLIVGVDKSPLAIKQAKKNLKDKPIELVCADIHHLPFPDGFFTKLFVQDGDAWMHTSKHLLMSEIYRVTAKDGVFIYQNYVCSANISEDAVKKMDKILNKCGYPETSVPQLEKISQMFQLAGFHVEEPITDLHDMYLQDNLRMLGLFEQNRGKMIEQFSKNEVETLNDLLEWEKELFSKRWWSGVLVIARKD